MSRQNGPDVAISSATADAALDLMTGEGDFVGWEDHSPVSIGRRCLAVPTMLWGLLLCAHIDYEGSEYDNELEKEPFKQATDVIVHCSLYKGGNTIWARQWSRYIACLSYYFMINTGWFKTHGRVEAEWDRNPLTNMANDLGRVFPYCLRRTCPLLVLPFEFTALSAILSDLGGDGALHQSFLNHPSFPREYKRDFDEARQNLGLEIGTARLFVRRITIADAVRPIMDKAKRYQELIALTMGERRSGQHTALGEWISECFSVSPEAWAGTDDKTSKAPTFDPRAPRTEELGCELALLGLQFNGSTPHTLYCFGFRPEPTDYGPTLAKLYGPPGEKLVPLLKEMLT